ncbi:Flp family type IVb pilin [Erythrobacter sp. JK5]|uniref:Flp family type IVb pilin n=1 Tax=Erythrobacter sp. JK5 TaxID=2829500 RepID=UPI001BA506B5|nr:Flp family type IVb pilin [Erythrobacter sp. JK5]QUL38916.1 Flp family type IVb pilin [Erythrobacter sp. JK5]
MILTKFLKHIGNDKSGATAVEYGLIAALIVIAAVGSFQAVGNQNSTGWGAVQQAVEDAMS